MKSISLLQNCLTYGLGQILTKCLNLILLPFFTNYLSVTDYGVISLLTLIVTFATSILTLGIGTSFGICHSEATNDKRSIVSTCFLMISVPCMLFLVVIWWWLPAISTFFFHASNYTDLIFISCLTAVLASLLTPFHLHLQFNHRAFQITTITVIFTILSILLNIFFIAYLHLGIHGQVWATFLSTAFLFALYIYSSLDHLALLNFSVAKRLLIYGLPMIPASFSLFFLQNSQRYFLDQYSTFEELGLYSVAYNIAAGTNLLVSAFSQAWTPYFLEFTDKKEYAKSIFGKVFHQYTFFFGIVSLASFVFASPFVKLLTPESFHPSAKFIGIISLGWIFIGFYNILNVGIVFAKRTYLNSIMQFGAVIAAYIGNIFLTPYGALGAAAVFVLCHLSLIIFETQINSYYHLFRPQIFWDRLLPFLITIVSFILLTSLITFSNIWTELAWGCLTLSLALCATYFSRTRFNEEQKQITIYY